MKKFLATAFLLAVGGPAHAVDREVTCAPGVNLKQIIESASARDVIILKTPVGSEDCLFKIDTTIKVNKVLTIRAAQPPREVDGTGFEPQVSIWIDPYDLHDDPITGVPFQGAFIVEGINAELTFENILFKLPELDCFDSVDNDGNGLRDRDDPYCRSHGAADTGAEVGMLWESWLNLRAFTVRGGAVLNLRKSKFQGFSAGSDGSVVHVSGGSRVEVTDSHFVWNQTPFEAAANGDFVRGRGAIFAAADSEVDVRGSLFAENTHRYGGAIYVQDSRLFVSDGTAFHRNYAEDGGAVFVESGYAEILGSVFSENNATLLPKDRPYLTYEGGAIFAEDSDLKIKNNVFLWNSALDWGAAITFRHSLAGEDPGGLNIPILIENNTFVENISGLEGGASVMADATTEFKYNNNISYWELTGVVGAMNWPYGSAPNVRYSLFSPQLPNEVYTAELAGLSVNQRDNVFADPQFVYYVPGEHADWRIWRFWLKPSSPAIDAGDPLIFDNGDPNNRSDIGAYGGDVPNAVDADGDGWPNVYDCNDSDPNVHPYAYELCNDKDDDCNGIVDDREVLWYVDRDYDGYGSSSIPPIAACPEQANESGALPPLQGGGVYVNRGGDCNDNNTLVNPGRTEYCDGIDNDCDGQIDENIPVRLHYRDADLDGFGDGDPTFAILVACPPEGFSPFPTDCNDRDATIHPLITFEARTHFPLANAPLERHEADRNPAFVADGIDQDCDGVDLCYPDYDGDGFGEAPAPGREPVYVVDNDRNCRNLSAPTAANNLDCDDGDPRSHPGGTETPGDGLDQDCDGRDACYEDLDGDGYGSDIVVADNDLDCDNGSAPTASQSGDCNDDPDAEGELQNPAQVEVCDGLDNNCDGTIDEVKTGDAQEFYADADGDGFGDVTKKIRACGQPAGYSRRAGDCDDSDPRAFPGNAEVCDGIDNNCEGGVDEDDAIDAITWHQDFDGDGFGSATVTKRSCSKPSDGSSWVAPGERFDCDDSNADVGPCMSCDGCSNLGSERGLAALLGFLSLALLRRRGGARAA